MAKQREWKAKEFHHLGNEICLFPLSLILMCLDKEEVYFLTSMFWKWDFSIAPYNFIGEVVFFHFW